jgi:hypothetical protein
MGVLTSKTILPEDFVLSKHDLIKSVLLLGRSLPPSFSLFACVVEIICVSMPLK